MVKTNKTKFINTGPRLIGVKNLSKKVMSSVHDYLLRKKNCQLLVVLDSSDDSSLHFIEDRLSPKVELIS